MPDVSNAVAAYALEGGAQGQILSRVHSYSCRITGYVHYMLESDECTYGFHYSDVYLGLLTRMKSFWIETVLSCFDAENLIRP